MGILVSQCAKSLRPTKSTVSGSRGLMTSHCTPTTRSVMERTRSRTPVRDWAEAALKLGLSCGGWRRVCRERAGGCVQNHCISCTHTRACTEALHWPLH